MVLVSQIKNNKLAILEGRTEDIEILSKTIKTMPNFFPDILDQFGYQLVQNKDREEMWSIHFPNGTGAQHIYNLHDLRTELRKIVEVNSQSMVVEGKSGTKTCPSCNLINSVAAARCDCGYNFTKRC